MSTQRCPKCKTTLPLDSFAPCRQGVNGEPCRSCASKIMKVYHAANKEKHNASCMTYRINNRERVRALTHRWRKSNLSQHFLSTVKQRAVTQGIKFELVLADLSPLPSNCGYCKRPLVVHDRKREKDSPSIDRIIPDLGYTKSNTIVVCWHCNRLKNSATLAELTMLAEATNRIALARGLVQ